MEDPQLDEYRRRMQEKHGGNRPSTQADEDIARALQEEENERVRKLAETDAEVARKLQGQYQPPVEQAYVAANPPAYQAYPVYQQPPPVYSAPAARANPYYAPPPGSNRENQPLLQSSQRSDCLPKVNDKCLGVNTQICVLTTAGVMTIGIVVALIILATA